MAPMSTVLAVATDDGAVIAAIIISRLLLPLLIPRYPLMILAALVLDAIDGSLLDALTSVDTGPNGPYQSFDKALDIYYLAIAYLSTLRNWTSPSAFRVGQFLFYYRLVGVLAFELLHSRAMLLIFPNTFEFFFTPTKRCARALTRRSGTRASGCSRRPDCGSSSSSRRSTGSTSRNSTSPRPS